MSAMAWTLVGAFALWAGWFAAQWLSEQACLGLLSLVPDAAEEVFDEQLVALAARAGVEDTRFFRIASHRSQAFSFNFAGRHPQVAFSHDLQLKLTPEQFMSIVAHELGHAKHMHHPRLLVAKNVLLLVALFLTTTVPLSIGAPWWMALCAAPLAWDLKELAFSRIRHHYEFVADAFAAKMMGAEAAEGGLLGVQRLSGSDGSGSSSHPPIAARIAALRNRSYAHHVE